MVRERAGPALELHGELPVDGTRTAWILHPDEPVVVVPRHRRFPVDAGGLPVVERASGGGAVLLRPDDLWIDLVITPADALWDDDVRRATHWVGQAWAAAIGGDATVHLGGMARVEWADRVCVAGLGPGEVTEGVDGPKLVGISQRRTRRFARFQCLALREWDPVGIAAVVGVPVDAIAGAARGVPELAAEAVCARLP